MGIDNPLDNPYGQMLRDKNGNYTHVNPQGPNQNLGKVNWGKVVTGRLMRYMRYYTVGISIISLYGGTIGIGQNTVTGCLEVTPCIGKTGIMAKPGDLMINKGREIEEEGGAGRYFRSPPVPSTEPEIIDPPGW